MSITGKKEQQLLANYCSFLKGESMRIDHVAMYVNDIEKAGDFYDLCVDSSEASPAALAEKIINSLA